MNFWRRFAGGRKSSYLSKLAEINRAEIIVRRYQVKGYHMEVDFDAFRKRGVEAFNSLVKELNGRIQADGETVADSRKYGDSLCVGDIRDQIDDLRNCLATLICLEDKSSGIKCLDLDLAVFAPEE